MKDGWLKVSKSAPCVICGKDHACKKSTDGAVAMCKRIEQGAFKQSAGWYFHRLIDRPRPASGGDNGRAHKNNGDGKAPKAYASVQTAGEAIAKSVSGTLAGSWLYHDAQGDECMAVVRINQKNGGKQFRPLHRAAGDGWLIGDPSGLLPLYRLPQVVESGRNAVFIVEGEKCADAAVNIGLNATTSAHGSSAAEKSDWAALAGRDVVILPDNDDPGRKYAADVAKLLMQLSPPAQVKIVELPGLPDKGDIVEFIEAHDGRDVEDIRREIEELAANTPAVTHTDVFALPLVEEFRPFPVEALPDPLRNFVHELAAATANDQACAALAVLVTLAGTIGNRAIAQVKRGWTECSVLWGAIVNRSGTTKSIVLKLATDALVQMYKEQREQFAGELAAYQSERQRYDAELSGPI